jgi:hypothetical protein
MKVLICGMSSQTVIRSIGRTTTCGELKRQLSVSRLMSCCRLLKDDHTFFDNDVIHVLGRLRGGMEVNWDQMDQSDQMNYLPDICHCLPLFLCLSRSHYLLSSFCVTLVVVSYLSLCLCLSYSLYLLSLYLFVFVKLCLSCLR